MMIMMVVLGWVCTVQILPPQLSAQSDTLSIVNLFVSRNENQSINPPQFLSFDKTERYLYCFVSTGAAVATVNEVLKVWDTQTGTIIRRLEGRRSYYTGGSGSGSEPDIRNALVTYKGQDVLRRLIREDGKDAVEYLSLESFKPLYRFWYPANVLKYKTNFGYFGRFVQYNTTDQKEDTFIDVVEQKELSTPKFSSVKKSADYLDWQFWEQDSLLLVRSRINATDSVMMQFYDVQRDIFIDTLRLSKEQSHRLQYDVYDYENSLIYNTSITTPLRLMVNRRSPRMERVFTASDTIRVVDFVRGTGLAYIQCTDNSLYVWDYERDSVLYSVAPNPNRKFVIIPGALPKNYRDEAYNYRTYVDGDSLFTFGFRERKLVLRYKLPNEYPFYKSINNRNLIQLSDEKFDGQAKIVQGGVLNVATGKWTKYPATGFYTGSFGRTTKIILGYSNMANAYATFNTETGVMTHLGRGTGLSDYVSSLYGSSTSNSWMLGGSWGTRGFAQLDIDSDSPISVIPIPMASRAPFGMGRGGSIIERPDILHDNINNRYYVNTYQGAKMRRCIVVSGVTYDSIANISDANNGGVRVLAVSPDGKSLLTTDTLNRPTVRSATTYEVLARSKNSMNKLKSGVLSPDGKYAALCAGDTYMQWDIQRDEVVWTVNGASENTTGIERYSPSGKYLLVSEGVLNSSSGKEVASLFSTSFTDSYGYSGLYDNEQMYVRSTNSETQVTNLKTGDVKFYPIQGTMYCHPTKPLAVVTGQNGTDSAYLYNPLTMEVISSVAPMKRSIDIAWSSDGTAVGSMQEDETMVFWRPKQLKLSGVADDGSGAGEEAVKLIPNPARTMTTVVLPKGVEPKQIVVSDVLGKVVWSAENVSTISLSTLQNGTYYVRIVGMDGKDYVSSLVVLQ